MSKYKKRIIISVITILLISFGFRIYIDNNIYEVTYLNIVDEEIPDDFDNTKILHISDLHNKSYGKDFIDEIDNLSPDYIFMTGDMVSSKDTDFSNFYELAKSLATKYNCYYILGNHEMDLSNSLRYSIYDTLRSFGVTVLDNEEQTITKGDSSINLYGMWYNPKYYMREDFTEDIMNEILGNADDEYNILLTHNPDDFEVYADWGADLIFAGHVHGGMIRLPFVGGVISPDRTLFPKYDSGIYEYNNSQMVVSRGLSRGATGFRLFNKPELILVTLNSK